MSVSAREAREALADLGAVRADTRRSVGTPWFPLVVFGAVAVTTAPLVALVGAWTLAIVWPPASVAGLLLVGRHYRRRSRRHGVAGAGRRSWAIGTAMLVGCSAGGLLGGAVGDPSAALIAPLAVAVAGYLALGWAQHSLAAPLGVTAGALAGTALALSGAPAWSVVLAFGGALVATGLALRRVEAKAQA